MNTHIISVKVAPNSFYSFPVQKEVYNYIRQLENAIKYPQAMNALVQQYPDRFSKAFPQATMEHNEWRYSE